METNAPADTVLGNVVDVLDRGREDMVDAVLAGMRSDVAAYRDLRTRDAELVREGVRLTVNQFIDLLVERRWLSSNELTMIESLGGVRAAQGVPLDDVLQGIRAAMRAGWNHIVGLVPTDAPAEAVVPAVARLGDDVFQFMQQSAALMTKGYNAHQRLGLTARVRARDDAIEELLSGVFDSDAEIERRAAALGIELHVPHGLLLLALPAEAGEAAEALRATKDALVDRLPEALDGSVRGSPTVHAVVAVPAPSAQAWQDAVDLAVEVAAKHHVLVLAADPRPTAGGIHAAYNDAACLMRIVRRVGEPPGPLRPDQLHVYRFLDAAGAEQGRAFLRRVLGPVLKLSPDPREKLLGALRAVARSNGGLGEAGASLFVHAKTVRYRLRRVEELTGLDVTRPLDRLQLDTAVLLLDLYPEA
ncbi:MAG: helix-turn-helix domain-containing protein [Actinomycetota bacterium]|nr:helix-turn-helix domain-containing protein [Actinomycetota bacterium]